MEIKTERIVAYGLAIVLFVVGVVCYAAFPVETPKDPVRILFKSAAGNILFDHKIHTSEAGYGIGCTECHHTLEEEGEEPAACGDCHEIDSEDPVKRADAFHTQCRGCHEMEGAGPVDCSACHVR